MLIVTTNNSADVRQNKPERDIGKRWRSFNDVLDTEANEPRYMGKRISYRDLNSKDNGIEKARLNVDEIKILNDRRALLSYDDKKLNSHKVYRKTERANENEVASLFNPQNEKTEIII